MATDNPQAEPLPTSAEIFRQALAQNVAIQQNSLNEIQRSTDEMHEQMKALALQRMGAASLPYFTLVRRAAELSTEFWEAVITNAIDVLKMHGEFPTSEDNDGQTDAQSQGGTDG